MESSSGRRSAWHLPPTYPEFEAYWDTVVTTVLTDNPQARQIVEMALHPPKFARLQWVPDPIWTFLTLPVTQLIRAGIMMGVPDSTYPLLGFEPTRLDKVQLVAHKALWRSIPRPLAKRFAPTYFALRRKYGTPLWRTEFSRDTLAANRATCPHAPVAS
nr:oxygenase MpaB family protein [Nocardioides speluncae]